MKIINLKTLQMTNPIGIDVIPHFSWNMTSSKKNVMQKAYHITVFDSKGVIFWDTTQIKSDNSNFISYEGNILQSKTRYNWTVEVWDNKGNIASDTAYFETALLNQDEWKAQWVEPNSRPMKRKAIFGKQPPATMFRKAFHIKSKIKNARVYASCHGIYRLTINGKRPDDYDFAPGFTVYKKYLNYQTFDITALLQHGENVIGMYVGDGWFCGERTKAVSKRKHCNHAALFQIEVEYENKSREIIVSDSNVKVLTGPVRASDLFDGEYYDANFILEGWDCPGFPQSKGNPAKVVCHGYENLVAQYGPSIHISKTLPATKVYTSSKGETIVDFGQVMAGKVRLNINIPAGTKITLDLFEVPDKNGNYINTIKISKTMTAAQKVVYISDGRKRSYEQLFSFHGFRYVRVTGLQKISAKDFTALALSSEMENTGTFECSNPRINRLYENTRWSQRSNFISIPTDCPQREKAGWTGDILIYATTSMLNENTSPFLTRWLKNLEFSQGQNGAIPITVPYVGIYRKIKILGLLFGNRGMIGSAGWGDAAVFVPWAMYELTGNRIILQKQYHSMKRWCDYIIYTSKSQRGNRKIPKSTDKFLWNTGFHFGEWLIPSFSEKGYNWIKTLSAIKMSSKYTAPIFGLQSISKMAEIANLLNKSEDDTYYREIAEKMKNAFCEGVIDQGGNMPVETMGAYVLPIYFDLVPRKYQKHFADKLVKMIEDNNNCLDTGFLGTPFILDALLKIHREDLAYTILYQKENPSWLYQVDKGATSIWESWNVFNKDGNPNVISLNHYAFGCVDDWMFRTINGIDKATPGFKHIIIAPRPDPTLKYAQRTFNSEYGEIVSNWRKKNKKFSLNVVIPANTSATIIMPNNEQYNIGSGIYSFSCSLEEDKFIPKSKIMTKGDMKT